MLDRPGQGVKKPRILGYLRWVLLAVLGACTTGPALRPVSYWSGFLPRDYAIYGFMDTKANRVFLEEAAEKNQSMMDILGRTTQAYWALDFGPGKKGDLKLLGLGDYPAGWLGLYLDWQSAFSKVSGPPAQWQYKKGLYVYQPENGAVLAGSTAFTPANTVSGPSPLPPQVQDRTAAYPVMLYLPRPGVLLAGQALGRNLPLKSLTGYFRTQDKSWTGEAILDLEDPKATRFVHLTLRTILRGLAKTSEKPEDVRMYQDIIIIQEENRIRLENIRLPFSFLTAKLKSLLEETP